MAIDFPLAPLRRYLWDHISEIVVNPGDTPRQKHSVSPSSLPHGGGGSGVSSAWAAGTGYEGFDNFRVELKKFSGGQSNPTFLLLVHLSPPPPPPFHHHHRHRHAGGRLPSRATPAPAATIEHRFVLRKKPASVKVSSAHAVEREFRVLRALRQTDVPVPRALLLCEDPRIIGTPFYVMEFVNGRIFSDSALPGMSRDERAAAYAGAAETLARLHRVDFAAVGLEGYGRSNGGYLGRQVSTLERVARKQAEDAGPIEGFGEIVEDLRELSAEVPDRVTLVHGDFRIDNLVFHPEEPRVIAVLDWELSTLGHPLADLANLCILHHLPASTVASEKNSSGEGIGNGSPSPLAGLKGLNLEALGIPGQSELMEIYRQAAGRDRLVGVSGRGVAELGLAFIFFKMAVIAHGVKARKSRGVASSTQASIVSAMVPLMIRLAREQIYALRRAPTASSPDDNKDNNDGSGGGGGQRGPRRAPRAVLFDVGGVLSESPLLAISRFEREAYPRPLPPSYIGVAIAAAGEEGLFQRLERGEERLGARFLERFSEYLCSDQAKQAYVEHVARHVGRRPSLTSFSAIYHKMRTNTASAAPNTAGVDWVDVIPERAATAAAATKTVVTIEEAKRAVAGVVTVDTLELFRRIAAAARVPVPEMIAAAEVLRRQGLKVAAVSNDFLAEPGFVLGRPRYEKNSTWPPTEGMRLPGDRAAGYTYPQREAKDGVGQANGSHRSRNERSRSLGISGGVYSRLSSLCDAVVLSSTCGCRKPDRRIYEDACEALGVSASEAVFVDDIRANIRAAEALGMQTVWVKAGGVGELQKAIVELETITGIKVVGERGKFESVRLPAGKL